MAGSSFLRVEDQIHYLIEGNAARLFARQLHPQTLMLHLAKAMEDYAIYAVDGRLVAPDTYQVRLNPHDHKAILRVQPDVTAYLAEKLLDEARVTGMSLISSPKVKLLADRTLAFYQTEVNAWHTPDAMDTTQSMRLGGAQGAELWSLPDAILILNSQHIPIDRPVFNLGRHRSSHVIIDNPAVSRHHAQIRLRSGHHILFDVSGRNSVAINWHPTLEAILQTGDVIHLGHTKLIYIADDLSGASYAEK